MQEIILGVNGRRVQSEDFVLKLNAEGLIPVVVQDYGRRDVLMLAYMNAEAWEKSLEGGYACFWSRSRSELWLKGETSSNKLKIREAHLDCDQDSLLLLVDIEGEGRACHTGKRNCFNGEAGSSVGSVLDALEATINSRMSAEPGASYTAKLLADENLSLKKLGEEATEVVMAAKDKNRDELIYEASDLLYHLLVVCERESVGLDDIADELKRRFK